MAEEHARALGRIVVAQLASSFDFDVVQDSALETLVSKRRGRGANRPPLLTRARAGDRRVPSPPRPPGGRPDDPSVP